MQRTVLCLSFGIFFVKIQISKHPILFHMRRRYLSCGLQYEFFCSYRIIHFFFQGILSSLLGFEKDFCIGLVVEACYKPTNIHMYVVVFNSNGNSTQETDIIVTGDTVVPIEGG